MKKFSKYKTKKGFTLLEVLLATAILVIISSMLMEGFISSMGFSYNSSVYSRSASFNSDLCRTKLAEWSMYSRHVASYNTSTGDYVELEAAYKDVGTYANDSTHLSGTLIFPQTTAGKKLGNINITLFEKKDVGITAATLGSFSSTEEIDNSENRRADNRSIFFYYPSNNGPAAASYFGNTHLYLIGSSKVWCYEVFETDSHGHYVLDDTGNKKLIKVVEVSSGEEHDMT